MAKASKTAARNSAPRSMANPALRRAWSAAKARKPKALVGVRSGDFLEFHGACAEIVADRCGIVITRQPVGHVGAGIARVGIPIGYPSDRYIAQLEAAGYTVAVIGPKSAQHDSEARPVSAAALARMRDDGTLARMAADLAERDRIRGLARELGKAWTRNDIALEKGRRSKSARARAAAHRGKDAALADVARLEAEMSTATAGDADDALALAVLLTDKLAAIMPAVEGDLDHDRDHAAAERIAKELVRWLSGEATLNPADLGMRSYFANAQRRSDRHADA